MGKCHYSIFSTHSPRSSRLHLYDYPGLPPIPPLSKGSTLVYRARSVVRATASCSFRRMRAKGCFAVCAACDSHGARNVEVLLAKQHHAATSNCSISLLLPLLYSCYHGCCYCCCCCYYYYFFYYYYYCGYLRFPFLAVGSCCYCSCYGCCYCCYYQPLLVLLPCCYDCCECEY